MDNLGQIIGTVARHFWGDPSTTKGTELRWGSHGSKAVDLEKGTWFDHENNEGGGVKDLILSERPELRDQSGAVADYLEEHFNLAKMDKEPVHFTSPLQVSDTYIYQNENGDPIFTVKRLTDGNGGKTFRQFRIENGQEIAGVKSINTNYPFHLPQIIANPEAAVFIVEGEKDVLTLENFGLTATCNAGGAGSWTAQHATFLQNRKIVIIPDCDDAGKKHASQVAETLTGNVIKWVDLGGPNKSDVSDWLALHPIDDLRALVRLTEPLKAIPPPLQVMRIPEILEMPPVEWLVENLIPEGSLAMLYGSPGAGKTFLALDMMLSISHGIPWHGHWTSKGATFYIAGEGLGGLRKRLFAWHKAKNIENFDFTPFFIIPEPVGLQDSEQIEHLINTINLMRGSDPVQAVVFDTVARCMTGDENSAQDMGAAIKAMDIIRNEFNCAVLPIHHSGKDQARGARGSTALIGAVDVSLRVERTEETVSLVNEKQKDAELMADLWFNTRKIEFQAGVFDDPETSIVLELTDSKPTSVKMTPQERRVHDALIRAIDDYGEYHGELTWKSTTESMWREAAYQMTISTGTADAQQKAFRRAADKLLQKGIVAKDKNRVWSVKMAKGAKT